MESTLSLVLILLATAVMVVVLCRILRLPVMLGYLAVGILIGPHALAWLPDATGTQHLAEFGVVFLMFSIGLEFSLTRLRAMKRTVFGLGGAQVVVTMLLVMAMAALFDLDWRTGLALGGVLAMSSTAIFHHFSDFFSIITFSFSFPNRPSTGRKPPEGRPGSGPWKRSALP